MYNRIFFSITGIQFVRLQTRINSNQLKQTTFAHMNGYQVPTSLNNKIEEIFWLREGCPPKIHRRCVRLTPLPHPHLLSQSHPHLHPHPLLILMGTGGGGGGG